MKTISEEYIKLNKQLHQQRKDYGSYSGRHFNNVLKFTSNIDAKTILDYGCGKGHLIKKLQKECNFERVVGFDPCNDEFNITPTKSDLVICTDVLEHVEPELLDNMLSVLNSLCIKGMYINIALKQDYGKKLPDGSYPHKIIQDADWWINKFKLKCDKECIIETIHHIKNDEITFQLKK